MNKHEIDEKLYNLYYENNINKINQNQNTDLVNQINQAKFLISITHKALSRKNCYGEIRALFAASIDALEYFLEINNG